MTHVHHEHNRCYNLHVEILDTMEKYCEVTTQYLEFEEKKELQ